MVGQNIVLRIEQKQEQLYKFRLRVEVLTPGTKGRTTQVEVSERVRTITLRPRNAKITIDPDGELLYAEVK